MRCPQCQYENPHGQNYCARCQRPLLSISSNNPFQPADRLPDPTYQGMPTLNQPPPAQQYISAPVGGTMGYGEDPMRVDPELMQKTEYDAQAAPVPQGGLISNTAMADEFLGSLPPAQPAQPPQAPQPTYRPPLPAQQPLAGYQTGAQPPMQMTPSQPQMQMPPMQMAPSQPQMQMPPMQMVPSQPQMQMVPSQPHMPQAQGYPHMAPSQDQWQQHPQTPSYHDDFENDDEFAPRSPMWLLILFLYTLLITGLMWKFAVNPLTY